MMKKLALVLSFCLGLIACQHSVQQENTKAGTNDSIAASGDRALLLKQLNDSIAMDTLNAALYLRRAKLYVENEQVGQAMIDVNKSMSLDAKNVNAYLLLSDLYYLLGDEANINTALNRASEIDPFDVRPLVKLAELNLLRQDFKLANAYIDKALGINTYNPKAYFVQGMLNLARTDTVEALKNYMTAREQDARFFDPVRQICMIYVAQKNPLAESFLRNAVQQFPDEDIIRYDLAMFLQDEIDPETALLHYDTLLMHQPGNSRLYFNKGYAYFVGLGDNEKALEYFDKAIQSDPNYVDALYNKGRVLEQMGNYSEAKRIYQQVLLIGENYRLAIDALNRIGDASAQE